MLVRYVNEAGQSNRVRVIGFTAPTGFHTYEIDLTQPGLDGPSVWTGKIIRFDILAGGPIGPFPDAFTMQLDWVRLHRADAPDVARLIAGRAHAQPERRGRRRLRDRLGRSVGFHRPRRRRQHRRPRHRLVRRRQHGGPHHRQRLLRRVAAAHAADPRPLSPAHGRRLLRRRLQPRRCPGRRDERPARLVRRGRADLERDAGHRDLSRLQPDDHRPGHQPAGAVNDENTVYKAGWRGLRISAAALRPQRGPRCPRLLAQRHPSGRRCRVLVGHLTRSASCRIRPAPPTSS